MAVAIVLGALGAAAGGALAGFVAAVGVLQARRLRNRALMARGQPGVRDCVLPLAFVPLCAISSACAGGVLAIFVTLRLAILAGALAPAGLLVASVIAFTVAQARQ